MGFALTGASPFERTEGTRIIRGISTTGRGRRRPGGTGGGEPSGSAVPCSLDFPFPFGEPGGVEGTSDSGMDRAREAGRLRGGTTGDSARGTL